MNVQERNETVEEVLVKPLKRPFKTLEELTNRCLPTLAARLWATCRWPSSMSGGWKIGDFNFLIVSVAPEKDAEIYIQFWSEPDEVVCAEVSSGEWSPATLKYVGPRQREQLEAAGFEIGGRAGNFRKDVKISSSAEAGALAREVLRILFEVFGYRGQWQLDVRRHRGERAEIRPTYTSLTPEDFAKTAAAAGMHATVIPPDDSGAGSRFVLLRRGRRKSVAVLDGRIPGNNLYSLITFRAAFPTMASDDVLERVNALMRFVRASRDDHEVRLEMAVSLVGGVTADWLSATISDWVTSCRKAEAMLKRRVPGSG